MRLEFQTGDAFRTAIELLFLICLLAPCGERCLGGSNYDQAWSIQQTADGGYVVAGYTYSNESDMSGNRGFTDRWRVRLKPSGNMEWQNRTKDTAHDGAYSVRRTADGIYMVADRANSSSGDASGNHGPADPWIIRQGELNCTIAAPDTVCSGSAGNVASAAESGDTYAWSITNGAITSESNARFISFAAGASGTTRLALIVTRKGTWNECHKDIAIKPLPECSWTSSTPVCDGSPAQFIGPAGMDAYEWEFGDGQTGSAPSPSHLYSAPGTYAVNLTVIKGGCSKDDTKAIFIAPGPDCSWTASAPVCNGTPVRFTGPAAMDAYHWDFGDGFACVAKDPVYLYHAPGTYTVSLKTTNGGCSKSCTGRVEVRGLECGWTSDAPVCNGTVVRFTGPAGMDSYSWVLGDGEVSSGRDVSHLYSAPGTYAISLTVSKGGCDKACTGTVEVMPMPDCSWTSDAPVCNGTVVRFTGPAGMDSYRWSFGDGAVGTGQGASHLYSAPGTYAISLTVSKGGCDKACTGTVEVMPMPDCSWTSSAPVCEGTPVQFTGPSGADSFYWDFGDGAVGSAKDPSYLYSAPGTYKISLQATKGGCRKDCIKNITIAPGPECTWTSSTPVCNGSAVQFHGPAGMEAYLWDFGDGQISSARDPAHLYSAPGTYAVHLRAAKAGCSKDCTKDISVLPCPDCTIAAPDMAVFSEPMGNATTTAAGESVTSGPALNVSAGECWDRCSKDIAINPGSDSSPAPGQTAIASHARQPSGTGSHERGPGDGQISSPKREVRVYPG